MSKDQVQHVLPISQLLKSKSQGEICHVFFFYIQRSKLVTKLHFAKASKTYNYLVFSTNSTNIYYERKGKTWAQMQT
jgi:hypothetical protein